MNKAIYAQIDNYLDLYRYAKQLNDRSWQADIVKQLKELQKDVSNKTDKEIHSLYQQFNDVNHRILILYRKLRRHEVEMTDERLCALFALKQRRVALGKEIDALNECRDQRVYY